MRHFFTALTVGAIFCGLIQTAAAQTFVPGSGPGWYGSLGTIMLNRENPEYDVLSINPFTNAPIYTTALVDFDTDFGYDLTFGRRFAGGGGLEARYFNVKMDTTLPTVFSPVGAATPYNHGITAAQIGVLGPTFISSTYTSRLQSVELNARLPATQNIDFLYGIRYLELAEELGLQYEPAGFPQDVFGQHIGARNEMFGSQFGLDALLFQGSWFSVKTFGKSGLYYNAAHGRVGNTSGNPVTFTRQSAGQDDEISFVSEGGLNLNLQLTRRLSFQTGYNLMYLGNVALASDQVAFGNPTNDGTVVGVVGPLIPTGVDTSHLWLHGVTMGMSWVW